MSGFHNHKKVKARKEHLCDCCKSKIVIGEEYEYNSGLNYGDFYTYKLCSFCVTVINQEFLNGDYNDGIDIECLLGDLEFNKEYMNIYRPKKNKSLWLRYVLDCWKRDEEIQNLKTEIWNIKKENKILTECFIPQNCEKHPCSKKIYDIVMNVHQAWEHNEYENISLFAKNIQLTKEIEKAKCALRFYANKEEWHKVEQNDHWHLLLEQSTIDGDGWYIAQQSLAELEER
jgi:hypothetical protein